MGKKASRYHHGIVIKEFREKRGMSQPKLAEYWPRSDGGTGVSVSYLVEVEAGRKRIDDQVVLRRLSDLLEIPLFKFGLSEYNPFDDDASAQKGFSGQGQSIYYETLDTAQCLIQQVWLSRLTTHSHSIVHSLHRLNNLSHYFHTLLPLPQQLKEQYLRLYVDVECLNGVVKTEKGSYEEAVRHFETMYKIAAELNDPTFLAHALMNLGVEIERKGETKKAIELLEQARDISLEADKPVMALVHSYMSRIYASDGDVSRFERATEIAQKFGVYLVKDFSQDTNSVFYTPSDILAERSYGYIGLGMPQKTIDMQAEIVEQIEEDHNKRLNAWIPLDWARAYQMLGEIEKCIDEARAFYQRVSPLQLPQAIRQTHKLLKSLEDAGYGNVPAVRDFRQEIAAVQKP
jgi:tetratricopeptide (TPR) repeat protein/transcriptional regulator with XRE-family HTH domain